MPFSDIYSPERDALPELAHETPSQDELKGYLQQHWERSIFATYWVTPEQASHWYSPDVAQAFISLQRLDGQAFAVRAFDAIFAGLNRMNRLPRNHPFWQNTNCRPTIYKLGEFCYIIRTEAPRDIDALWAAAILPVWFGRNDFGQEAWLELSRLPEFDLRYPLNAALTTHLNANSTEEQTYTFLREANAIGDTIPILRRLSVESAGLAAVWAHQVLQLIEEPAGL